MTLSTQASPVDRTLLGQAGLEAEEADSGAVTLIQRFGSAANVNIYLHCLVLDGVYRRSAEGAPEGADGAGRRAWTRDRACGRAVPREGLALASARAAC